MNAERDLDRRLTDLYASEADLRAPDRVLGDTLRAIETTRQRRWSVRVPWLSPTSNGYARAAVVAVVVIAVGAAGLALLRPYVTAPASEASPSPFPTPAVSARPLSDPANDLKPGRYQLDAGFPIQISFDVPAGWARCSISPLEQSICSQDPNAPTLPPALSFLIVENVVADPCSDTLLDPPVGPTVDDLVLAIANLQGFQATTPKTLTVGGFPARQFEVIAPSIPGCDLKTWATPDRINGVGGGELNELWIVDVDGARVLLAGAYFSGASNETLAELNGIVNSIQFGP
jgi:hypothetical protein